MNKKRGKKNTYMTKRREKKTKEQNINLFQSLLGGLIGLPERDRAWTPFYHNIRWNVSAGTKVLNQYQLLIFEKNVIKSSYNQVVFMTAVEVPTPHPTPQSMVPLVALASELVEETTNSACIYKQQHSLTQAF